MAKKKRSAKQLANDKRLGRMAKQRAKLARAAKRPAKKKRPIKKAPGRKKGVRRKKVKRSVGTLRKRQTQIQGAAQGRGRRPNPKRKKSAKSHLWYVFKCYGKSVRYLGVTTGGKVHWTIRDAGVIWKSKGKAATVARTMAKRRGMANYDIGVASGDMTSAQIAAGCKKGKG